MFFDEFMFHHKRGLKRWERIGHPVDTFFFLVPFIYTLFFSELVIFVILCIISCVVITKDEFVHKSECCYQEQWLHSVLFILHPISLFALYFAWQDGFEDIIVGQCLVITMFFTYQIIYWNFWAGDINHEAKG